MQYYVIWELKLGGCSKEIWKCLQLLMSPHFWIKEAIFLFRCTHTGERWIGEREDRERKRERDRNKYTLGEDAHILKAERERRVIEEMERDR